MHSSPSPLKRLFELNSAVVAVLLAIGCGATPVAPTTKAHAIARPAPPATCHEIGPRAKPLFVDAPAEERARLETAMTKGLAVVAYDCHSLRVLEGCSAFGDYAFTGTTPADALIHLISPDEIQANLPETGAVLGASLALDLGTGATLDVARRRIGVLRTTRARVDRADLRGTCEGATHVVVGASLGALAMQVGSGAHSATDLIGAAVSSGDGVATPMGQGSLDACQAATLDAPGLPAGCGAVIDLDLHALDTASDAALKVGAEGQPIREPCPNGMVSTEGKCGPSSNAPHLCAPLDDKDCAAQCDKGSLASCNESALVLCKDGKCDEDAFKLATRRYRQACEGGEPVACRNLARHLASRGPSAPSSPPSAKNEEPSPADLRQRACDGGDALACFESTVSSGGHRVERACHLGSTEGCAQAAAAASSRRDNKLALESWRRSCAGGDVIACEKAGDQSAHGQDAPHDHDLAKALWEQGCGHDTPNVDENAFRNCLKLADAIAGHGAGPAVPGGEPVVGPAVPDAARALYTRVCDHAQGTRRASGTIAQACLSMGRLLLLGSEQHPADPAAANVSFRRACDAGDNSYGYGTFACYELAIREAHGEGMPVDLDAAKRDLVKGCFSGYCRYPGQRFLPLGATPDPQVAALILRETCDKDVPDSCRDLARLLGSAAQGVDAKKGEAKDAAAKALASYVRLCEFGWSKCLDGGDMLRSGEAVSASAAETAKLDAKGMEGLEAACQREPQGSWCQVLAQRLLHGRGVKRDPKRAIELYEHDCDRSASACNALGEVHRWADGVPRSYPKAAILYRRSCAGGSKTACSNLAALFAEGKATPTASEQSVKTLFEDGCLGSKQTIACLRLGVMYAQGDGVAKDEQTAATTFAQVAKVDQVQRLLASCEAGLGGDVCSAAGFMLARGLGIPKDEKRGVALMKRGCKGGDDWGCARSKEATIAH